MEFVSDSEYITALLLIPIFSAGLFLLISFLEILEMHGEILFINKTHAYTNKDFIFPLLLAVLVGLFFYWFYFMAGDYVEALPPSTPDPCTADPICDRQQREKRIDTFPKLFKLLTSWINKTQ